MSVYDYSPSNSSLDSLCFSSVGEIIFNTFYTIRLILLIPISIFILYLGSQQWWQHRSFKAASHSDIFTYNVAIMELIRSLGAVLYFIGVSSNSKNMVKVGIFITNIIVFGVFGFHALTCMDRYLAVVHPVKYRELRNSRGVTIRNISIVSVWLISLLLTCISHLYVPNLPLFLYFGFLLTSMVIVSFCSLSVLYALFRLGPGVGGGSGGHIDQSKQRAFITVMTITGFLCLSFLGFLIPTALAVSGVLCTGITLVVQASLLCLTLPSSLVSPLLYLHKAGKLRCGQQGGG